MNIYLAGVDKPHRCPMCWTSAWGYGDNWRSSDLFDRFWRFVKYLPRKCNRCGAITLSTRLHGRYERRLR